VFGFDLRKARQTSEIKQWIHLLRPVLKQQTIIGHG